MDIKAGEIPVVLAILKWLDLCKSLAVNAVKSWIRRPISFIAVISEVKRSVLHYRRHGELDQEPALVGRDDLHQDEPQRSQHHLCQAATDEAFLCRHRLEGWGEVPFSTSGQALPH